MHKHVLAASLVGLALFATACGEKEDPPPTAEPVTLKLWNAYSRGGGEELALKQLIEDYKAVAPHVQVEVTVLDFGSLHSTWDLQANSADAPDLFIAPNDDFGNQVRRGVLADLSTLLEGKLENVYPAGVQGMSLDGKMYGVPLNIKAVGLYVNQDLVSTLPATTSELLAVADKGVAITNGAYHLFGFFTAFNHQFFDANGYCADQAKIVAALQYMLELKAGGATFNQNNSVMKTAFTSKQAAFYIGGPWELKDLQAVVPNLKLVALPAGPGGVTAMPLSGVDGLYVAPGSKNKEEAVKFALHVASAAGQGVYAQKAGNPPVRSDVTVDDSLIQQFSTFASQGMPRPQTTEFGQFWEPFRVLLQSVLEQSADPTAATATACASLKTAIDAQ